MTYTPEPWGDEVFRKKDAAYYLTWEDWERARECVNACAGIDPQTVPEQQATIDRLESEKADLLEVLEEMVDKVRLDGLMNRPYSQWPGTIERADAVIGKVRP